MNEYQSLEFINIPLEWNTSLLGDKTQNPITILRNGLTAKQNKDNGEFRVSRIETIGDGFININRTQFVSNISEEKINKFLIQKGDILFSHINSDKHLGKTGIAYRSYDNLLHGMNLLLIRSNEEILNPLFLNFIFMIYRDTGVFIKICSRAVNQSSINQAKMRALEIPLPPLPEQRKIAYVLSTIQKAIEKQQQIIETTTELKKALMQKLFTEGLYGEKQKQTEIGLVPESWEVVRFEKMVEFTKKPRKLKIDLPINFIPMDLVSINDIFITKSILKNKVSSGTYAENGDVILAKITPSFENGKQGIIKLNKSYCYATTEVIPFKSIINVSNKLFLFYFLKKEDIRQPLAGKMEGSTGRQRLSKSVLKNLLTPKPTADEQSEIAHFLSKFDEKNNITEKKKSKLEELFKSMLNQLMTGQTRVNEVEFENVEL